MFDLKINFSIIKIDYSCKDHERLFTQVVRQCIRRNDSRKVDVY